MGVIPLNYLKRMEPSPEEELIEELFHKPAMLVGETLGKNRLKKICRNRHLIFNVNGQKVIVKAYKIQGSGDREKKAYDFFTANLLINVPHVYYADSDYLVTKFIDSREFNLLQTIEDWSRVHMQTFGQEFRNIEKYSFDNGVGEVLKRKELFGRLAEALTDRLLAGPRIMRASITHGDLYCNNILTTDQGNYYIDFENWGVRDPLSDLGLLLFNHPDKAEDIMGKYKESVNFLDSAFEEDVYTFLAFRLAKVFVGLYKDEYLPEEFRRHFSTKALAQLERIL